MVNHHENLALMNTFTSLSKHATSKYSLDCSEGAAWLVQFISFNRLAVHHTTPPKKIYWRMPKPCSGGKTILNMFLEGALYSPEKQNGVHSNWQLRDLCLEADAMGTVPFNQHVQLFRRALQWMNNHEHFHLFSCPSKRKVDSLRPLDLSAWHRGYSCRPKLACGERTMMALRRYFVLCDGKRKKTWPRSAVSCAWSVQYRSPYGYPVTLLAFRGVDSFLFRIGWVSGIIAFPGSNPVGLMTADFISPFLRSGFSYAIGWRIFMPRAEH